MRHRGRLLLILACGFLPVASKAFGAEVMEWTIAGETRQAMVFPPSVPGPPKSPVVLVFHGHGGTMQNMERLGFQREWPEAIVVCPQGLPTKTALDQEGKRSGWQPQEGNYNNRDLKLVDAILKTLREKYPVDDRRVFATGHSNGGAFVYLLWGTRSKDLAAIGPVAAGARAIRWSENLTPLPVIHIAGEKDDIVPLENQQRSMAQVRKVNGCSNSGQPWKTAGQLTGTLYASTYDAPLVAVIHPGGHGYPADAPKLIVQFFQEVTAGKPRSNAVK